MPAVPFVRGRTGIAARDRLWLDARSVLVLDGMDVPAAEAIRAALRRWAAASPEHPVFRLLTPDRSGWQRLRGAALDEHCDAMVVPLDEADGSDPDDLVTRFYGRAPEIPLRFAAGPRLLGFSLEHVMFDSWGAHRVFASVLRAAATGSTPEDFLDGATRTPLLTALARAGRQDPRRLARTLRGPRPGPPAVATPGGAVVPWSPAPRLVTARSGPETLRALRAWRRGAPHGATIQNLLFAAARVALEAAGLPPRLPGLYTLADSRRYLDADTRVAGNFSIPIYLDPADPTDPVAIGASLTAQLDAGVPLVTTAAWLAHAARDRVGRRHGPDEDGADQNGQPAAGVPTDRPEPPAPVPILNHLGRLRLFDPLPWRAGGADARYRALVTQGGPEDLTIYLTELRDRLNVCIGFHDNVFATDRVRSVADALAEDPVALVTRQPVRQR